jgi:catechol 2,3-dioxygenase-like lactoylglutathione lyase family enzyme
MQTMLNPTGLIRGHYECRSFDQTIPILSDLLALEVVGENNNEKTLKHPNTDWRLVIHANGPDTPIKPMRNHYGVRVTNNAEVDRATEYLERKKEEFGIKIIKPRGNHNAYSVHFYEPGGNYWEIESYEHAVETGMGKTTNPHWTHPLPTEKFSGKGYVPQALTHGTLENEDLEASERFYREVLGLEVVKLWPSSCYIKHPATPWYVVCIQALKQNRQHLSRYQRFTLAVDSVDAVHNAYRSFDTNRRAWKIKDLEKVEASGEDASFLFSDLNGNWWEITSAQA